MLHFKEELRFQIARHQMVDRLIRKGVLRSPAVIEAFKKVPRHLFLDSIFHDRAYQETSLPIGLEQTISHPSTVAGMTELLAIEPHHRVLEIGTGSGYQTAVCAELAGKVYSVEFRRQLMLSARNRLEMLGYSTVRIEQGDGSQGWPDAAPFDRIIVTAGAPDIPENLCRQLAPNGRLVIPVGPKYAQKLILLQRRLDDAFETIETSSCEFVDLVGKHGWPVPPITSGDRTNV